jgi:hypothetical protein
MKRTKFMDPLIKEYLDALLWETIIRDFHKALMFLFNQEAGKLVKNFWDNGRLTFYAWFPSENDEDGLTFVYIDKKTKEKSIVIYINQKVLVSPHVCWRMGIILHELAHMIQYLHPGLKTAKQLDEIEKHGSLWRTAVETSFKRGNIKENAYLLESTEQHCLFQGTCVWCFPEKSFKQQIEKIKRQQKRITNQSGPSVCLFCPAPGYKYRLAHLRDSKPCQVQYMKEYKVKTFVDLKRELKKEQDRKNQRNTRAKTKFSS